MSDETKYVLVPPTTLTEILDHLSAYVDAAKASFIEAHPGVDVDAEGAITNVSGAAARDLQTYLHFVADIQSLFEQVDRLEVVAFLPVVE